MIYGGEKGRGRIFSPWFSWGQGYAVPLPRLFGGLAGIRKMVVRPFYRANIFNRVLDIIRIK